MAHIRGTHDSANLFHGVQVGTQATVHGEDLLVDDGCDWQAVEAVRKCLPQLDIVPALALIIEAVDAVDAGALVISAKNEKVLGILDLVCEEQADGLERLLASVDIVAEEKVVGFRWEATILEQAQEIVVLPVNVTTDLWWGQYRGAQGHVQEGNTLMGASSSRRIGCCMKISRALVQR